MAIRIFKISAAVFTLAIFYTFFGARSAEAAQMYLILDKESPRIGETLNVDLKIDSEGTGINAAEAVLQFPKNILEAKSISKDNSVFNFWLEEPAFSNEEGKINFIGGTTSGVSGASLHVLRIVFVVKGGGSGDIAFLDGAVTASDGSGTNVLNAMRGAKINVSADAPVLPGTVVPPPPAPPAPVEPPTQITRPPVPTGKLPVKPELQVPLYPDPSGWYNLVSKFSVLWLLPDDVTNIATLLNNIPTSNPTRPEGLFENKSFAPLQDGIWYLHVRFRNDIGWGPTAHYRIGIDTAPPVPFEIQIESGLDEASDNPSPVLSYKSGDDLSGLKHYAIRAKGGEVEYTTEETYKFKPLAPGQYTIAVGAVDNAGNISEDAVEIEILPIESPAITFVSERVILDQNNISIAGTAVPNAKVNLILNSEKGDIISGKEVVVDSLGNWSGEFSELVRRGEYYISAQTIDERGAQSLFVRSPDIVVKDKPVLTLFGVDISRTWFFILLIIIMLGAFGAGFAFELNLSKQRARGVFIARRDISNAFGKVVKDIDAVLAKYSDDKIDETEAMEMKAMLQRLKADASKSSKYIEEGVEDIK